MKDDKIGRTKKTAKLIVEQNGSCCFPYYICCKSDSCPCFGEDGKCKLKVNSNTLIEEMRKQVLDVAQDYLKKHAFDF